MVSLAVIAKRFRRGMRNSPRLANSVRLSLVALSLLALASSATLIPSERELAILDMEAGDLDSAISGLERAIAEGDSSAITSATLARALAETADIEGAISVLEGVRARSPGNTALLEMLADYYDSVGRRDRLVSVLAEIQTVAPTLDRQHAIALLYDELGWEEEQREALWALVDTFDPVADDYVALARLEAASARPEAGAEALRRLAERHPEAVTLDVLALDVSLLLASRSGDLALGRAARWFEHNRDPDAVKLATAITDIFAAYQRSDLTVALLEPIAADAPTVSLLEAILWAQLHMGDRQGAVGTVNRIQAMATDEHGRIVVLFAALSLDDRARAVAMAEQLGVEAIPVAVLADVAVAAMSHNATALLDAVAARVDNEEVVADPVTAARLYLALGDRDRARHYAVAAEAYVNEPGQALRLAGLELALGRRDRALAATRVAAGVRAGSLADAGGPLPSVLPRLAPGSSAADIGHAYRRLGNAREGAVVLSVLREQHPSAATEDAWAQVSAAAGRTREVMAWLIEVEATRRHPLEYLQDVLESARTHGDYRLAIHIANRLVERRGNAADILQLAQLRIAGGHPWSVSAAPAPADRGPAMPSGRRGA